MIEIRNTQAIHGGDINMYTTVIGRTSDELSSQCQMFVRDFGWQPFGQQYYVWAHDSFYQVMVGYE